MNWVEPYPCTLLISNVRNSERHHPAITLGLTVHTKAILNVRILFRERLNNASICSSDFIYR